MVLSFAFLQSLFFHMHIGHPYFFFCDLPRFFIWVCTFVLLLPKSSLYIKYLTWFSYLALFFLFAFQVCSWYILLYRNFSFLCGQTWFSGLVKFSIFSFSYLPHLAWPWGFCKCPQQTSVRPSLPLPMGSFQSCGIKPYSCTSSAWPWASPFLLLGLCFSTCQMVGIK